MRPLLLLLALASCAVAADPGGEPVAIVDGEAITLRTLEDELLKREGADLVRQLLDEMLPQTPWARLDDADPVLATPAGSLTRADLIARLAPKRLEGVFGELLDSALVERAALRAGVEVDDALIAAEVARARRALRARAEARGLGAAIDLESVLRQEKGVSLEEWVRQPGFRWLVAGLHALVREEAARRIGEAELRARFDSDPERFRRREASDCSVIFLPYETTPGPDGAPVVAEAERRGRGLAIDAIRRQIADGTTTFGAAFRTFARSYDGDADAEGRVGWVRRDGTRDSGGRILPPEVVRAAFAVRGPYPFLLPPIAHDAGIDLVLVHGWRPETPPEFAAARARLLEELVEADLDRRSADLLARLRAAAKPERGEDGGVRTADGIAIALRTAHDALLVRHGADEAVRAGAELVARIDWSRIAPDADVLWAKAWKLPRRGFALRLLTERGAKAREDLITLALIRHALARGGLAVDNAAVELELGRLERAYRRSPEAAKRDFGAFIRESYGASIAELRQDPAFRLLAGTGLLVRARTTFADDDLKAWFAEHPERFSEPEAVELATIFLPYRPAQRGAAPTAEDRQRALRAAQQLHAGLAAGGDFAKAWRELGRAADPYARDGGRLGWIARDGGRDNPAARRLPAALVAAAFAAKGPFPALLEPVAHEAGIDVAMVHGRRDARTPAFAALIDRVREDRLEAEWDRHLQAVVDDLRRAAAVEYRDLAPLIAARRGEAADDAPAP